MKAYTLTLGLSLMIGMVSAATIEESEYSDSLKDSLRLGWDFNTGNNPSYVGDDTASSVSSNWHDLLNSTDGYGVVSGSSNAMYHTGLTGNSASPGKFDSSAFTISLDINALTPGSNGGSAIFDLGNWVQGNNNGGDHIILKTNSQNCLTLTLGGNEVITTEKNINNLDWTTVTLTSSRVNASDTNQTLTLYIDGESVGTATGWISSQNIDAIQFGSVLGSSAQAVSYMEVDNIYLWNRALSSAEVKSLQVPEPTSTSLSLLALGTLALRRQRK